MNKLTHLQVNGAVHCSQNLMLVKKRRRNQLIQVKKTLSICLILAYEGNIFMY